MAGLAHRTRTDLGESHHIERTHGQLEALALLTQQRNGFEWHVVKEQFQVGGAAQAHHHLVFAHGEAGQPLVHHEHADFSGTCAVRALASLGGHQEEVAPLAVADEVFATIQHPTAIGLLDGASLDTRRVRASTRFGNGNCTGAGTRHRRFEPTVHLRALAMQQGLIHIAKGATDQIVGGVAELFLTQDAVQVGQATTAQFGRHVHRVQAQFFGLVVHGQCLRLRQAAVQLELVFEGLEFIGDESTYGVDHHFLFVVEGEVHVA